MCRPSCPDSVPAGAGVPLWVLAMFKACVLIPAGVGADVSVVTGRDMKIPDILCDLDHQAMLSLLIKSGCHLTKTGKDMLTIHKLHNDRLMVSILGSLKNGT